MEKYLFANEKRALLEGMQVPFAVYQLIDKKVVTLVLSEGFCNMFGYRDREKAYSDMNNNLYMYAHPDDVARIADEAFRFASDDGGKFEVIYRTRARDRAEYNVVHAIGKHTYTETGARLAHVWYTDEGTYTEEPNANETTLNKALNDALHQESILNATYHDYLTGLPRMTYFFELAESEENAIENAGKNSVILFFDLSGMKAFNSKNGFAEGDKLLKLFSELLIRMFGSVNCCHAGVDHFSVCTEEDGLEKKLYQLFAECKRMNDGNSLPVHVGIYQNSLEHVLVSTAVDRAKYACDELHETYGSCFNYFNEEMREKVHLRQHVVSNLNKALEEKWVQVYYQPIVRAVNGQACDEEALARWVDPVNGLLSPSEFIPYLESAGILYKLDLYVLEQVLAKINRLKKLDMPVISQSINLSRSDFDSCDIVEEIRKRVDDAGVEHNYITIEITESVVGSNFEYMKEQIERFQALGFPVWMDDFGSGYSSMDVLQEIAFDLVKFDMNFMRKYDKGTKGKIILTELIKMTMALGVDTVCEGIETEDQVHFLQDIGCSRLQGYYYHKPASMETYIDEYTKGMLNFGYEDPEETDYYESIDRVNLYDLAFVVNDSGENTLQNIFNTIPMGILEIEDWGVRLVRSNQAYRDFIDRYLGFDLSEKGYVQDGIFGPGSAFMNLVKECCQGKGHAFFDEEMPDGSTAHTFARKISINPVTGKAAAAIAILSISEPTDGTTYASIARVLASDYYNIYYVDMETERFIEYSSPAGSDKLAVERHGDQFFAATQQETVKRIYEEDREPFIKIFTKENILKEISERGVFKTSYRLIDTGKPQYADLKAISMQSKRYIIMGISIVDSKLNHTKEHNVLRMDRDSNAIVEALSGDYLCLYTIDPQTGYYREYSSTDSYKELGLNTEGNNFFYNIICDAERVVYPDDLPLFREQMNKENVLATIKENGMFKLHHRIIIDGEPKPVSLKIAMVRKNDGDKLIAGIRVWKERKQR
ncbi:MAG: EAL domain-containing protein [Clostridiales bacterium]|nr:EAL domain-containing protein [Clostridiales bacterium]